MKKKLKPLIPPDVDQCQAIKPGDSFMRLGGQHRPHRCTAKPTVIAEENKPGTDGRKGSMSLCENCKRVMVEQLGADFATFRPVKRRKTKDRRAA